MSTSKFEKGQNNQMTEQPKNDFCVGVNYIFFSFTFFLKNQRSFVHLCSPIPLLLGG
jgi:hypothetical protein